MGIALSLTFSVGFLLAVLAFIGPVPVEGDTRNLHSWDLMTICNLCRFCKSSAEGDGSKSSAEGDESPAVIESTLNNDDEFKVFEAEAEAEAEAEPQQIFV